MLGVIGAAMFFGDSVITPAISVLSAVEGLKLVTPAFEHYVVPITILILVALFAVQRRGTANVAAFFGPVMVLWFLASRYRARCTSPTTRKCFSPSIRITPSVS